MRQHAKMTNLLDTVPIHSDHERRKRNPYSWVIQAQEIVLQTAITYGFGKESKPALEEEQELGGPS